MGERSVNEVDYHAKVGEALGLLVDGLAPFVAGVLEQVLPEGMAWTEVLRRKDAASGRRGGLYSERDLSLLLRSMTEQLGELGFPFSRELSRQGQNYASELRQVRNQWAHHERFTGAAAFRALDSAELLLREVRAQEQAEAIGTAKAALIPAVATPLAQDETQDEQEPTAAGRPTGPPRPDGPPAHDAPPAHGHAAPSIRLAALPVLSYAMAHCRVAIVDEITIEHHGPDLRGASLEVDVVSAHGSLGGPKVLLVDLADGRATTLRSVDLVLDPARMLRVEEQQPGQIRAVLRTADGATVATASANVDILAANQWRAMPMQLGMEMLATHVQPNALAIAPLLREASDHLHTRTGRSALDGYQSENPDRVDAIAASIYDAMRDRDIRYAEPPASWGAVGQKVRTPSEVLEGRLGTCLDTTVTMAAALEQAGINATLWLLDGHCFVGYWRHDSSLAMVSTTDVAEIVNLVDLRVVGLVETTALTGGNDADPFDAAVRSAKARVDGDLSAVIGVTDIRQARATQIFPLPSRSVGEDGTVIVSVYQAGAGPVIAPYEGAPAEREDRAREIPRRVAHWKNALLDLSLRNRLINYTERSGYRLDVPPSALARLEDQISAHAPITLVASDAVGSVEAARGIRYGRDLPESTREVLLADKRGAYIDITQAAYVSKLRYVAYKAKTIVEETGSNNLYLAFGMLSWRFNDRDLHSPLVLVPVTLSTTNRGSTYRLTIDDAGASTPNYCLLEKLRVAFGLEIPGLADPTEDASGIDLAAAFHAVRLAVVEAGLPFRVEESVHLAILQFAKYPLWKDIDEHWAVLSSNSLVKHLVDTPLEGYTDPVSQPPTTDLDELGALVPVPADSSQLDAVAEAVAGRTFVLEGPPGTGKSQTITNLLARALAAGRRVLFVAEKRAALDVVKKRLESVGLGDLSLDLHDKGARPPAVRAQIKAALDARIAVDADGVRAHSEAAESARRRLALYAGRLHETNAAGHSLYSAHAFDLAADHDVVPMNVPQQFVSTTSQESLDDVRDALRRLPEHADLARPRPSHPWRFVDDVPDQGIDAAHRAAVEFDDALEAALVDGIHADVLEGMRAADDVEAWERLAHAPRHPLSVVDAEHAPARRGHLEHLRAGLDGLGALPSGWRSVVTPAVMDRDVAAIHAAAVAADQSGFFGRKKRRRAVLGQFADCLTVDPAQVDLKGLSALTQEMAATHGKVVEFRAAVRQVSVPLADGHWNPAVPEHAVAVRDAAAWLVWTGDALAPDGSPGREALREAYASTARGAHALVLARLAAAWRGLVVALGTTQEALDPRRTPAGLVATWRASRAERGVESPVSLERWVDLVRTVEPLRRAGLDDARAAVLDGRIPADDAVMAFDRGVARASVAERQGATALAHFDLEAHTRTIQRFTGSTHALREELRHAIPAEVVGLRSFDANSAGGQVGGLRRQLDRQRGGMSVRALMDTYGDVITQVLPCTLMSPESVARFFPARADLFDIVVFDEASQIRVADAIGAMGRARSVVVVGDSKQMPPTQFAEASATIEEDEEYLPENVTDEESILNECVQARVPSKWLSWHYRSQDESLIAFSNHHYYENRLSSFPAPITSDVRHQIEGYGISLVRVDGTFERGGRGRALRTNRIEAEAIVAEVRRRFWASPDGAPSLGVITFNAQQRDLIENLLRDSGDDRIVQALDEVDGLFVKNLENVQGDERDSILFSVAFSANDRGVVPLNFGPLSKPGGERRLNVAVTRARRQVVLFASFDPEQLRAEETTQRGTKHLKAYLELAARGVEAVSDDGRRLPVVDRHRDDIAAALREEGFVVTTDVGLSDFRIDLTLADADEPGRPLVAVLLDGPGWRARRTVADRDGLPVDVLEGLMRWPCVERVWLPEWLRDRDATLERLRSTAARVRLAAEEALVEEPSGAPGRVSTAAEAPASPAVTAGSSGPAGSAAPAGPSALVGAAATTTDDDPGPEVAPADALVRTFASTTTPAPEVTRHPLLVDYVAWDPGTLGDVSALNALAQGANRAVVRAVRDAIETEGPIQGDRLARLVAGAFGLRRVSAERRDAIKRVVPSEYRADDGFYWPPTLDPTTWLQVRVPPEGESRPLDEVSLVEIANAMRVVCEQAGGMSRDELKRAALRLFGGRRVTEDISRRLESALALGHETGRLDEDRGIWLSATGSSEPH